MKYTKLKTETKNSIRLQSIGLVQGEPAENIKVGDVLMWNFGKTHMYNLMFENVCLNKKPLTKKEAIEQMNLIIITYGYRPTLEKIS
jgi:hypothetical protein